MTWFGIVIFIYYCVSITASMYYAGNGGLYFTPASLIFTALVNAGFLLAILFVGTGLGVL